MSKSGFVHLHAHSVYSLLDGHSRIPAMVRRAAELDMPAIALTDHGVLYGAVEFFQEAGRAGVKPIIGCEFYVAPRTMRDREFGKDSDPPHLTVLAADQQGYRNLLQLVTAAHLEGQYFKPRVDKDLLARHSSGLIALSGCLSAEIPSRLLADDPAGARAAADDFVEIFGKENFYIEIQDQGIDLEQKSNAGLLRLAAEMKLPLVATNDIHYVDRADAFSHDVLLCIQTAARRTDQNRMRFSTEEFYLKSPEEMSALFRDHPEALANTLEVAGRCNAVIPLDSAQLPRFDVPAGDDVNSYLTRMVEAGVARRYPVITDEVRERMETELSLIHRMGFSAYFLIVWDFIRYARENGIPVGPGRGSATGSIVAYALGITSLDPLRYGLIFERFLNSERISMPDIDIDFSKGGRDRVIRYVVERYGADRVAQIVTFQRMMSSQAIRDVARVLEVPVEDAMRITNLVRKTQGKPHGIEQEMNENPEFRTLVDSNPSYQQVVEIARGLEGVARNAGVHAAGVVIGPEPLANIVPLTRVPRARDTEAGALTMTQYDMNAVQKIGLLKMDFLGLRNLDIIVDCVRYVEETTGEVIDIDQVPLDDARTFELMSNADTLGTFQLEGQGMRRLLDQMRPTRFEDVIVIVSLFRPGCMEFIPDYCQRKHGQAPVTYLLPELEPILAPTYGVIVYQEQVMEIARQVAGFTLGQADVMRSAMGKKDKAKMATMRDRFISGAVERGITQAKAEELFAALAKFAEYGFNKSHAAAYALVSYQTAYLKANYPLPYAAALLTNHMGETEKVAAVIVDARSSGIEVLAPDLQRSGRDFTIDQGRIVFGLRGIKNVGERAIDTLVQERDRGGPFLSLVDLCRRVNLHEVNKRVLESLVKCGAADSLGERAQMLASLDMITDACQREQRDRESGQVSLFEGPGEAELPGIPLATGVAPATTEERLRWEKELVGLYISDHPLNGVDAEMRRLVDTRVAEVGPELEGQVVRLGGMVRAVRTRVTRKGDVMAFVELEDLTGVVELTVFPRTYEQSRSALVADRMIVAEGVVEVKLGGAVRVVESEEEGAAERVAVRVDAIWTLDDPDVGSGWDRRQQMRVDIPEGADDGQIAAMRSALREFPGSDPVQLRVQTGQGMVVVAADARVSAGPALEERLHGIFGRRVSEVEVVRRRAERQVRNGRRAATPE
ncbi:MAG: DNA polymerase III subunit alpha [Candidatus Dormibacteria bacterium]